MTFDRNTDADETPALTDVTTGEELHTYTGQLSDGREFAVAARDEDTARRVARDQAGGVGVLSISEADAVSDDDDSNALGDVHPVDDDSAWTERADDPIYPESAQREGVTPLGGPASETPSEFVAGSDSQASQADGTYGTDASPDGLPSGSPAPSATDGENVSPSVDEFGNVPTPQGDNAHDASTRDAS